MRTISAIGCPTFPVHVDCSKIWHHPNSRAPRLLRHSDWLLPRQSEQVWSPPFSFTQSECLVSRQEAKHLNCSLLQEESSRCVALEGLPKAVPLIPSPHEHI